MRVVELTFHGRIPSKKNSRNLFVSKGAKPRIMNLPSKAYADWHNTAAMEIVNQMAEALFDVQEVQMEFYMPDNRKCDLTNKAESIMDLLVDIEILEDDSWQCVPNVMLTAKGVDKKDPRVKVWIKYED